MKTLIIVAHPDLRQSRVNRAWTEALRKLPDATVRHLENVRHVQTSGLVTINK
jgi:Flavodoxin-like fold.